MREEIESGGGFLPVGAPPKIVTFTFSFLTNTNFIYYLLTFARVPALRSLLRFVLAIFACPAEQAAASVHPRDGCSRPSPLESVAMVRLVRFAFLFPCSSWRLTSH